MFPAPSQAVRACSGRRKNMKLNLYVIFDVVAQESGPVVEAQNDGVANRNYQKSIINQKLDPNEFKLFCIGSFDHSTNEFISDKRQVIITLKDEVI